MSEIAVINPNNGEVVSFEDIVANGSVKSVVVDPFTQVDKSELIGVDFVIIKAQPVTSGDAEYWNFRCITSDNQLVWFNDGSTGIAKQLIEIAEREGQLTGLRFPNGLRASTYDIDKDGQPISKSGNKKSGEATTYYFA